MYLVYFKTIDDDHRCLFSDDHIETLQYLPSNKEVHHFEVFKGYDATDEGLRKYKLDLIKWSEELKENDILSIDYLKYYCHYSAVEMTFKRLCKGKYEHFDQIDRTESKWIESTHNGGLTYCDAGTYQCYGYDFSSFYPCMMGEFKFKMPFMKGKEVFITELNDNIALGFYRVKITSDNKHATKLFAFSKNHVYNNISINHALELSEYNFKVELIIDDKPNAYIYDKEIRSSKVFSICIDKLMKIKKKHPKNKLIKHLMSSLWGSLSHSNNIMKTYDEIQEEGLNICMTDKADYKIADYIWTNSKEYYKLQDMNKPYKSNFRLKSFLTAFGRVKIAEVALENLDAVKRIHTDGIAFNQKMKFNIAGLIPEDKTTGMIKFDHVNKYEIIA
jgi:hypothetical protein